MPDASHTRTAPAAEARAEAPGRVNLIGEHTDYHGGFVLPTVLPQTTEVWGRRLAGGEVRAASAVFPGPAKSYALGEEHLTNSWVDYVQGVTWVLRRSGAFLTGFDVTIASSIPAAELPAWTSSVNSRFLTYRGFWTFPQSWHDEPAIS